jgi:hypothetical protein
MSFEQPQMVETVLEPLNRRAITYNRGMTIPPLGTSALLSCPGDGWMEGCWKAGDRSDSRTESNTQEIYTAEKVVRCATNLSLRV